MKKIILNSSNTTDAGEFKDGGSILEVGEKHDIAPARARELVAEGRAEEYKASVHEADTDQAASDT